ncbi:MAG: hypothetical protein HYV29_13905 [Ignavibacteriales bacterium]|nr:hypothetical protein [Ignavibacteriales bacterium]
MKRIFQLLMVILTGAVIFSSCEDLTKPDDSLDKIVFPETQISYNRHVQPVFNIACATSGCHDVQTKAGDLDLTDHFSTLYSKSGVVVPHDTSLSRIIWSIEGRPGSAPMPPQRSLNMNQIRGFKQWIMEGATDTIP